MRNQIVVALAVAAVIILFLAFWLKPIGEGEYRDSPNGQWTAHVSALSRGTLLGSRQQYVELSIERRADGVMVWRQELPYTSTDKTPDYGDRSTRFITWASDSTQFSVSTINGAMMTVPITVITSAQQVGAAKR